MWDLNETWNDDSTWPLRLTSKGEKKFSILYKFALYEDRNMYKDRNSYEYEIHRTRVDWWRELTYQKWCLSSL